ncbi:MAG TPA: hypothetical protein VF816_08980 [Rhodocyclaceae bacterium]
MDVLSHGLWGGIAFGRRSRRAFWTAVAFGMAPDLLAFGPHFAGSLWSALEGAPYQPTDPAHGYADIPSYVFLAYQVTHSLVVFTGAFLIAWLLRGRPWWPMAAWGLHVLMDIPTHGLGFFPTPFLWPLFDVRVDGIPWSRPVIFVPNVILLSLSYLWYFLIHRRKRRA